MIEESKTKRGFKRLHPCERRGFIKDSCNAGFLTRVVAALAAQGITRSLATVSRTWHGAFRKPDPAVEAALEAEYQKPRKRLIRAA